MATTILSKRRKRPSAILSSDLSSEASAKEEALAKEGRALINSSFFPNPNLASPFHVNPSPSHDQDPANCQAPLNLDRKARSAEHRSDHPRKILTQSNLIQPNLSQ